MDKNVSEVFWSAVPTHQFLLVDKIHSGVLSKHFPFAKNDVSKRVVMQMISGGEEVSIIWEGLQWSGSGCN